MNKKLINNNFLLENKYSKKLFHNYAKNMPIFDYHCHLPVQQIAEDINFENITRIWLYGDHYKWRQMRTNGVDEKYCTGDASDWEKFFAWAKTIPYAFRNPLYHWTYLELASFFDIKNIELNAESAKYIYDACNEKLKDKSYSTRNLMLRSNVKGVCTTDDPLDDLAHHKKIKSDDFKIAVLPTFRPDKGMFIENVSTFNTWINNLESITSIEVKNFDSYLSAIKLRHDYFHNAGCRLSDHGIETIYAEEYTLSELNNILAKVRDGKQPDEIEKRKFHSAALHEFALMDYEKGWVQQLHIGALRNNNSRLYKKLGADTGFDSIADLKIAAALSAFLDKLDNKSKLPKTIIYNLNPKDNEVLATMIGNFQDGSVAGKMQFGSGWWFLDQLDGMTKQINALSNLSLLSRFVGMLTDSRSFLSYPRHEYFRRLLCNIIGTDLKKGLIIKNIPFLGSTVQDICFNNIKNYTNIDLPL